jgi:DNA primase
LKFTQEFIEKVSEANNLVDIISQYTQLKSSGSGLMGRCPFPDHPEKTASFSVSEVKQVYHCFGCHKKGNIFTFLQQYNGMSFKESVEYLADRAHIALPKATESQSHSDLLQVKRKQILKANQISNEFFRKNLKDLPSTHPVNQYVQKRGLTAEIIESFQIGYSAEDWEGLVKELSQKNISLNLAEEAKLVKARSSGKTGYFDLFRERLMFPILSVMGETLGFGGRIIATGEPKYLNSPETPVFHKGKILYGLYQTAKYIRSQDQVVIVEGYMDLISLYAAGIKNSAATMGTALTFDHAKILSRMTKNVVVLFDGDAAGQEAAERSLPILLSADVYPKGFILPNQMDPDDFVRAHGAESLTNRINQAKDLFSLVLDQWLASYRGEASEKVQLASKLSPLFSQIRDLRLKQLYLQEAADRLGVNERWLIQAVQPPTSKNSMENPVRRISQEVSQMGFQRPTNDNLQYSKMANQPMQKTIQQDSNQNLENSDLIDLKGASKAEDLLVGLALRSTSNFEKFQQACSLEEIPHEGIREVLKRIAEVYRQAPEKFDKLSSLLATFVNRPEVLIADQNFDGGEARLVLDCIRKIRERRIAEKRASLTQELKKSVSGSETYQNLMKALMDLKIEELNLRDKSI